MTYTTPMIELRSTVTGKVQRVGYRDFVQAAAHELGLVGSIQNKADGSVAVIAHGEPEALKQFVEYLHEGSTLSRVDEVGVEWGSATVTYTEFQVLP